MIKPLYVLILFLLFFDSYSQKINSGVVTYGITLIDKKDSASQKMMLEMYPNFFNVAKEIEFELSFNSNQSIFTEKTKMYSDQQTVFTILAKIAIFGNTKIKNDSIYKEYIIENIGQYIVKSETLKNWKITEETKKIDKFVCYKATNEVIITNPRGTFKNPIIAWFCPEIPFQYGPNGFGGLPGLILEIQTTVGVFGAKKITLSKEIRKISGLKNLEIVSEAEYDKISMDNYKAFLESQK